MTVQRYSLVSHDWVNLEYIINDLTRRVVGQVVNPTSSPTFGDVTVTDDLSVGGDLSITGSLTLSDLTASRLAATDGDKILSSVTDLTSWIAGTENQITVADDEDGSVTLSTPQDIATSSDVEFQSLLIDQNTDAIGLNIDSEATTLENYGLQCITGAGAGAAYFASGDGNNGAFYCGLPNNVGLSANFVFARNLTAASTDSSVVYIVQDHADDDRPCLELKQDGSGPALLVAEGGSMVITGGITIDTNLTLPDDGWIGSTTTPQSLQVEADGDVVFIGAIDVPSDIVCGGHVIFDLDNGHIGYLDNSPMITFNNADDQAEVTGDLTISGLSASRLVATDGSNKLISSDLVDWVTGTANEITVANDGDGTITLSLPQILITNGNTAIGFNAIDSLNGGNYNVAVGYNTLTSSLSGSYNTSVGGSSGTAITSGNNNTLVGYGAGNTLTTGSNNILVGFAAGVRQTTNSNLLIIDNQDRSSAANEITNSLIYGVFNADPASQTLRLNAAITMPHGATVTGTLAATTVTGANVTTGADPGHTHTAYEAAGAVTTHESTYNHANYNTAYSHSQLTSGNPHQVTPMELGLVIGTNVQAWDAQLDDMAALAVTDGNFIVGNGTHWVAESGATARASIGLNALSDGETIGQIDGALLTFDNTNNHLKITGCRLSLLNTTLFNDANVKMVVGDGSGVTRLSIFGSSYSCLDFSDGRTGNNQYAGGFSYEHSTDTLRLTIQAASVFDLTASYVQYAVETRTRNIVPVYDNTYYLGKNDDDSPAAWKGIILKDQTTGTYYRLQIDSGSVNLIDLTD